MSTLGDCDSLLKLCIEHSWAHFEYHASQRLVMLRFFLLALGFLFAAYGTAFGQHEYGISCSVAIFTATLALLFWFIDVRNVELIKISERPLKESQIKLAGQSFIPTMEMIQASDDGGPKVYRYSFTIPALFGLSLAFSIIAAVYALKHII